MNQQKQNFLYFNKSLANKNKKNNKKPLHGLDAARLAGKTPTIYDKVNFIIEMK